MHQQHFNACPVTHEKIYTDLIFNSGLSTYTKGQFVRTYYDVAAGTGFYPASFLTQNNLRKRVAYTTYEPGSGLAPASTSYQSATYYDYDYHGNVKTILSQNKDMPATDPNNFMFNFSYQRVDYRYDLVSGKVLEVMLNKGREDQYYYRYGYDDQNRLRRAESSAEGYWYDTDADYIYYLHGPLARVEYGQNNVQGADYAYTVHGWLKSLNSEKLDPTLDPGKDGYTGVFANTARDAYGFALSYYQGDYTRTGTGGNNFLLAVPGAYYGNSNLYNGNIVAMNNTLKIWNNTATVEPVLQVFGYDQLNRIAESHAYKQNGAVSSIAAWNAGAPAGNLYRTGYTYDANGNIKNLQRYHATAQIDNLTYNYLSNKNQLGYVTETIGAATVAYDIDNQGVGNYTYDNIGNLLSDASEQIQEIKWNVYGKVTEVIRTSGSARPNLKFSYDAAGRRITKAATWSGSTTYTFYTLDAQGNTLAMYSKTSISNDLILEESMLYGTNRIGLSKRDKKLSFVAQTPTPVQVTRGQKRYELSNHLGNVHVVVSDRKKTECSGNTFSSYEPEIINTYDYYPFGMLMEERKAQKPECTTSSSATTKTPYNYGFSWLVDEGFAAVGTNVTLDQSTSALAVDRNSTTTATGWGASKGGHNLVKGVTYTLSYQLQGAAPTGYTTTVGRTVQVRLKWGTSVMASGTLTLTSAMQSGSFNYTADYTGAYTIEIVYTGAAIAKGRFLADNVKITYNSQLTTVNCASTGEKYLYGFNGKEKIDEQYGIEGTAYDFGARLYDSRLGRWMASDPEPANFNAPYVFAQNSPAIMIDIDGKYEFFFNSETGRVYVTGTANSPNRYFVLNNNKGVGTAYRQVLNGSEIQERILSNVMAATLVSDNAKKGSDEWRMANRTLCDLNQSAVHDGRKKFLNHPATKTLGITLGIIITGGIIGEGLLAEMILETAAEEGFEYLTGVPLPIINDPADLLKLAKNWDNVVKNMPLCFVAGTKVKTAAGYKNIEDIVVGDLVWAFNDSTGQINLRRVENVVVKQATELILIDLGSEKIWTTPKHPFWLNNQWVEAKDLQVSDALTRFDGTLLTIKNILRVDSVTTVYNFAVEEYHTYYVTDLDILVHNDNPCSQGAKAGKTATEAGFKTLSELGLKDGMKVSSSRAIELGEQFLGKGYKELVPGSGRYISADGTRAFRMGKSDITGAHGGGPHVNFETLIPNPSKPGKMMVDKNYHIYITK